MANIDIHHIVEDEGKWTVCVSMLAITAVCMAYVDPQIEFVAIRAASISDIEERRRVLGGISKMTWQQLYGCASEIVRDVLFTPHMIEELALVWCDEISSDDEEIVD